MFSKLHQSGRFLSLLLILLFLCRFIGYTQTLDADTRDHDLLFNSHDPLQITIQADFVSLFKDRGDDRSYHKGRVFYLTNSKDTVFRKVKLKTRGNFRRDPENCKYPPILVKFGKSNPLDSIFENQNKLKLVIQCQIEKYVLLEYLAYRIYNELSDYSYKVRLAHITYTDINTNEQYATRYGFFIENKKELADRFDSEEYNKKVLQYFMDRRQIITMALFQYLIGNDDWYVVSQHNITVLENKETEALAAVPYDFDWSKLVNASYTKPANVPDQYLKERRVYKGLCLTEEDLDWQSLYFVDKKAAIMGLISTVPGLKTQDRKQATKLVRQFYSIIDNESSLSEVFQKEMCVEVQEIPGRKKSPTY